MRATCPACGFGKEVGDALASKTVRCPQCREKFRIAEAVGEFEVIEAGTATKRKQGRSVGFWLAVAACIPLFCCGGMLAWSLIAQSIIGSNSTKAFGTVGASIAPVTGS